MLGFIPVPLFFIFDNLQNSQEWFFVSASQYLNPGLSSMLAIPFLQVLLNDLGSGNNVVGRRLWQILCVKFKSWEENRISAIQLRFRCSLPYYYSPFLCRRLRCCFRSLQFLLNFQMIKGVLEAHNALKFCTFNLPNLLNLSGLSTCNFSSQCDSSLWSCCSTGLVAKHFSLWAELVSS